MLNDYKILRQIEDNLLKTKVESYYRDDYYNIDWSNDVIGIFGERGVGKTTIMLQKRKEIKDSFYFSADNVTIKSSGLFNFIFYVFNNFDIKVFFIDEIFKYTSWKEELKNIIDSFPQIKIVFSGSSSMALYDGVIDLGRRVYDYKVNTLSFREFLKLKYSIDLQKLTLEDILSNHQNISIEYSLQVKDIYFKEYLIKGVYPFGLNIGEDSFINRLQKTLDRVILEDLPYIKNFQTQSLDKLSRLLYFISQTSPSELSINHLSKKVGVDKNIVDSVLFLLSKIGTINLVQKGDKISEKVRKEYKILLGDTNKYFVYNKEVEVGTIREAFFVSEIKRLSNIEISLPSKQDYLVKINDKRYIFEIGGKNKKVNDNNVFILKDNIIVSEEKNIIPLWLFGFLG